MNNSKYNYGQRQYGSYAMIINAAKQAGHSYKFSHNGDKGLGVNNPVFGGWTLMR